MSSTAQKSFGEPIQTTTTFSYAQAAKGKSPSVPMASTNNKAVSDTPESESKTNSMPEIKGSTMDTGISPMKRTPSEDRTPQGQDVTASEDRHMSQSYDVKEATRIETASEKSNNLEPLKQNGSTPSSPGYGTTSTSTLPKEDDTFSNVNGSMDSVSDKQSQTSQVGSKVEEKDEVDKAQEPEKVSWDEETPALASFKEAPAPAVNVWQQRREAQAKSRQTTVPTGGKVTGTSNGLDITNGIPVKGVDLPLESKKSDGRKKGKTGFGSSDESSSVNYSREKSNSVDDGKRAALPTMAPPPPPSDAVSWPTPDTVSGDSKKKAQEQQDKGDRDAPHAGKPHGKEKWVPVPFVPTAVFNTPMPTSRRGGRPQRGGREGGSRGGNPGHNANGIERANIGVNGNYNGQLPVTSGNDRSKNVHNPSSNSNAQKPKRASSAGPTTPQEQRKFGSAASEKRKASDSGVPQNHTDDRHFTKDIQRPSATPSIRDTQNAQAGDSSPAENAGKHLSDFTLNKPGPDKRDQNGASDMNMQIRHGFPERRNEISTRPMDLSRENNGPVTGRERGEGRLERGRGGHRGRGGPGHAYFNPHGSNGQAYSNGYQPQVNGMPPPQSRHYGNHERQSMQSPGYQPPKPQARHYRTSSRSQSIPHSNSHSRFSGSFHGTSPNLANLQTDVANEYGYQPGNQGIMSAMPYNPTVEDMYPSVLIMLELQLVYYFSIENMCKDMHLRKHMDSQGFVPLSVVMGFNRMKALTTDPRMIWHACRSLPDVELIHVDGIDLIRRRNDNPVDGWPKWVLSMEQRHPEARNAGPSLPVAQSTQGFEFPQTTDDRQHLSPRFDTLAMETSADVAQYQPVNGAGSVYGSNAPLGPMDGMNGPMIRTPLSAAVSDFSPSARSTNQHNLPAPDSSTQSINVFTDVQVDNLNILVRKSTIPAAASFPPFHTSSSRTFSNGSIDGRSINEELTKFAERLSGPGAKEDAFPR